MKFTKLISLSLLAAILMTATPAKANPASAASCAVATKGMTSAIQVLTLSLVSIYNVLPIKIGGIPILPSGSAEDITTINDFPICFCLLPLPRFGIKVSLWEPIALVEPVAIPFCTPTLGVGLPISVGFGALSFGQSDAETTKHTKTYQVHYIKYPLFKLLQLFMDFVCLAPDGSVDYLYISELDPLWQNDIWAAFLAPESFLVANPIAELACIVDAVTANFGFPLDPLWWCLGSWNGTFPMTQTNKGTSSMGAQGAVIARMIMKLHRQLILWQTVGEVGLCMPVPMPIMRKSMYGIFPIYPHFWPFRIPIGRSDLIWGALQETPLNMHAGDWVVYRKRDCCLL